jgi:glycosyltransferase involved in cell wall biosynthesis
VLQKTSAEIRPGRGVVVNGAFLSTRSPGLGRMASELVLGLDALLADPGRIAGLGRFELACLPGARPLELANIVRRPAGGLDPEIWEQTALPWLARGRLLINLCNTAPLAHRGGVLAIHDAHVFMMPESHSPSYAAWRRFALPRAAARATRLFTVSEFSRRTLAEHGVAPEARFAVIPNGADHLLRTPSSPEVIRRLGLQDRPFVLAVANAQKHKNVGVLLKAFSGRLAAPFTLVLVGRDGARAFAAAGHAPPAPPRVIFAGRLPDGELRALYEAAVCLAAPSLLEGFGLMTAEAMSLGCPVVASPRAALPEVCGEAAAYADPEDPDAWIGEIRRLAGDAGARAAAVAAGLRRAAGMPWSGSARALLGLIAEAAAEEAVQA